jgi:hypothetical protein
VSVDTYLRRKNVSRYHRLEHEGVAILLAPRLIEQAASVHLDVGRSLFRRTITVAAEPRFDHFHGPGCAH